MNRPEKWKQKLCWLALFGAVLGLWFWRKLPCVFRLLTGIICPGCGMTRAWQAVLRLELKTAFAAHPMFWSVPVLALFAFYDGRLFKNRRVNAWVLWLLLGTFFLCYGIRLAAFFRGDLII